MEDSSLSPVVCPIMSLALGYTVERYGENRLFRLPRMHLAGHVCVVGRTGSGKSATAKILIYELARRDVPVLTLFFLLPSKPAPESGVPLHFLNFPN